MVLESFHKDSLDLSSKTRKYKESLSIIQLKFNVKINNSKLKMYLLQLILHLLQLIRNEIVAVFYYFEYLKYFLMNHLQNLRNKNLKKYN